MLNQIDIQGQVRQAHIIMYIMRDGNLRMLIFSIKKSMLIFVNRMMKIGDYFLYRWDEWVDESRVLKYNESNLEKHKQMIKSLKKLKPAMKRTINDSSTEKSKK